MEQSDLEIRRLRPADLPTPLKFAGRDPSRPVRYHTDRDRVLVKCSFDLDEGYPQLSFERAGPRERIAYRPGEVTAGIVTCGGLCPGLNDVIHGLVMSLRHHYGVGRIIGIRYGFRGLSASGLPPLELTPERVGDINHQGGTILGTSRGSPPVSEMADALGRLGINQFYVIGGDGTQRGCHALAEEIRRRGMDIAVVGIPKTIDNDVPWMDQSFGFATAVEVAASVIDQAHVEARSAEGGIGLVKLMGRDAGFVAAKAALASLEANLVLIPEIPFDIDGRRGVLSFLEGRLERKDHAVIVVAEGAGQEFFAGQPEQFDASGNRLQHDIGMLLKRRIAEHFRRKGRPVEVKYFDPSYLIRSGPANAADRMLCMRLAHNAVHAAMAGKTDMMVGRWYNKFTHVPLALVAGGRKRLKPHSTLWRAVLEATGQPGLRNV